MIKEIAFTIYPVTNIKNSREFYESVLGLKPNSEIDETQEHAWIEYDVNASTFAIGCSPDWKPSTDGASIAFEVFDIEKTIEDFKNKNVAFFMEKQDFPECSMLIIEDPDKNKIIIHQRK